MMLDLRPRGLEFDYKVVSIWIDDCLRTVKPSQSKPTMKVNAAFHPSRVGKSKWSNDLPGWG